MSHFPPSPISAAQLYSDLYSSIAEAISIGPDAKVWTPGFGLGDTRKQTALKDVFIDELADKDPAVLNGTMHLYRLALESADPAVRLTAQAIVAGWANRHAVYHYSDALADAQVAA